MPRFAGGITGIALIALVLALSAGCSRDTDNALRFGLAARPVTLDPRFATDATSARINRLLYRQLVEFDSAYKPVPSLASWEKMTDLHYRFSLRDSGRQFHNGSRLTAADVKATYEYVLDERNASPHRSALMEISRIEVHDDNIVV